MRASYGNGEARLSRCWTRLLPTARGGRGHHNILAADIGSPEYSPVGQLDGSLRRAGRGCSALSNRTCDWRGALSATRNRHSCRQGLVVNEDDLARGRSDQERGGAGFAHRVGVRAGRRRATHAHSPCFAATARDVPLAHGHRSRGRIASGFRTHASVRRARRSPQIWMTPGSSCSSQARSQRSKLRTSFWRITTARTEVSSRRSPRWRSPATVD